MTSVNVCIKTQYFPRSAMRGPNIRAISDYGEVLDMEHPIENTPARRLQAVRKLIEALNKDPNQYRITCGQLDKDYYFIVEDWT